MGQVDLQYRQMVSGNWQGVAEQLEISKSSIYMK